MRCRGAAGSHRLAVYVYIAISIYLISRTLEVHNIALRKLRHAKRFGIVSVNVNFVVDVLILSTSCMESSPLNLYSDG
jgi:hypothetical protein